MANTGAKYVIANAELEAFKKDYYNGTGGKYNLDIQAPHLAKLADGYLNRYKETGDWTDALKAHTLYNSVAGRQPKARKKWTVQAIELQAMALRIDKDDCYISVLYENINILATHLQETRKYCKTQLAGMHVLAEQMSTLDPSENRVATGEFCEGISQLSLYCTDRMITLSKLVFQFSVESLVEDVPCGFCVVALGSLAKGEATPYSDFEYMFIVERKDEHTLPYFEKLAMASYFLIGYLQETKLDGMAIAELAGWFQDKQRSGFKIDGLKKKAGNIPTGNGSAKTKNWLILTLDALLKKYHEIFLMPDLKKAKIGDFTAMLHYTRSVYTHGTSSHSLLEQFNTMKITQASRNRIRANFAMFKADSEKFGFKPTERFVNQGFSINTKNELYRYPSILLNNISIILGVCGSSSWETLQMLSSGNFISESIHKSLSFLLACSCYFRLSTYLFYDSQDDRLSVLPLSAVLDFPGRSISKIPDQAGKRWYLSQGLLDMYCKHSIPLKSHITKWIKSKDINALLNLEITPSSWWVKFQTYHYCNRWSESQHYFQEHIEGNIMQNPEATIRMIQEEFPNDLRELLNCVKALTYSLSEHRHEKVALQYNEEVLKIAESSRTQRNEDVQQALLADIHAEIGTSHYGLHQYSDAKLNFEKSLELYNGLRDRASVARNVNLLAKMHLKLGECHLMMYECEKSIGHFIEALQICYDDALDSSSHSVVSVDLSLESPESRLTFLINPTVVLAHVIWTMGIAYQYTKYYQRAFLYFQKALEMFLELYGENGCHKDIANTLYHLGVAEDFVNKGVPFAKYFMEGFLKTTQLYGTEQQLEEVISRIPFRESESFYDATITTFTLLNRFCVAHSQSATVCYTVGNHISYRGYHDAAERSYALAWGMLESPDCPDEYSYAYKAQTLAGRATNNWKNGDGLSAEPLYNEALDILSDKSESCCMLDVAEILINMGDMYVSLAESTVGHASLTQYCKAKECYTMSKRKHQSVCADNEHPQLLEIKYKLSHLANTMSNSS